MSPNHCATRGTSHEGSGGGWLNPLDRPVWQISLSVRSYARAGRMIEVPMAPYSYYPMLLDMLYTPWVYWGYDFVPKWIHALFGFLTGLLLYAYCAGRMNAVYGLLGFFFFVSTPAVARLSHWGYIDLGITFYTTAALICSSDVHTVRGVIPLPPERILGHESVGIIDRVGASVANCCMARRQRPV